MSFHNHVWSRLKEHSISCIVSALIVISLLTVQIIFIVKPIKVSITDDYCAEFHEPKRKVYRIVGAVVIWITTYIDFLTAWCFEVEEESRLSGKRNRSGNSENLDKLFNFSTKIPLIQKNQAQVNQPKNVQTVKKVESYDFESPISAFLKPGVKRIKKKFQTTNGSSMLAKTLLVFRKLIGLIFVGVTSLSFGSFFETIQHFTDLPYINFEIFVKCGWKQLFTGKEQFCHGDLEKARQVVKPGYFYVVICLVEIFASATYFYIVVYKMYKLHKSREKDLLKTGKIGPSHRITFLEVGFSKAIIFAFTEIPVLMILEFFVYELLVTDHHGENFAGNEWIAINNIIMLFGIILYSLYAVDYFLINTHPSLKSKRENIRRKTMTGFIIDSISYYHLWMFLGTFFCLLIAACIRIFISNVVGTRFVITEILSDNKTETSDILKLMKINPELKNSCSQFSLKVYIENISKFENRFLYVAKLQIVYFICCVIPFLNFVLYLILGIIRNLKLCYPRLSMLKSFKLKIKNAKRATIVTFGLFLSYLIQRVI